MGDTCHHHPHEGPPDADAVRRAVADVDARLVADGERMTPARLRVLELLLTAGEPVKAYDLIARFGEDGQPAKPPTVYRALDFLEKQGFAHRIESLNAYVACRMGGEAHAAAFLICDCCGATRELEPTGSAAFLGAAEAAGYSVQTLTIEARGRCEACRAA